MTNNGQDTAMDQALRQYQDWEAQGRAQGDKPENDQQISAPSPRQNARVPAETQQALAYDKTLEGSNWVHPPAQVGQSPEELGQTLEKNGATMQEKGESGYNGMIVQPDSTVRESPQEIGQKLQKSIAQDKNQLDNPAGRSSNEPSQGKEFVSSVREEVKGADADKTAEPELER